jgi:alkanesulfonate monooxygenase SsuD/methylene tetrahydromethanopterin reductase-like flavin-dependent oxidoreductase (luciferase family)
MRYGVSLGAAGVERDPRALAELAALAEASGWDGIFLEDYLVYQGQEGTPTYDPWVVLAAMAMATTRIRLGTTVTPVPRRRPWKLASEAVTLDHLSGGRLILGVGAGDIGDLGFGATGEPVDPRTRAELLDEGLDIVAGLWSGEPISYRGRHHRVDGLRLSPRPLQRPRIPIWVGGDWRLLGVRRRVTRWDGSCAYNVATPQHVRDVLAAVERERGTSAGFDVKVGGERDPALVRALAAAGATWWNDWMPPGELAATRKTIGAGPLRV